MGASVNNNKRFLDEALLLEKKWLDMVDKNQMSRSVLAAMMVSARLCNELPWPPVDMKCSLDSSPLQDMGCEYHCPICRQTKFDPNIGRYRKSDPMTYTVKCFICEKDLVYDREWVYDGGVVHLSFGYGSRHDQMGMRHEVPKNHLDKLLCSNEIEGYICDDCVERKQKLLRGFHVMKKTVREETTNQKDSEDEPT